jgi:serine/threonine protein kinase
MPPVSTQTVQNYCNLLMRSRLMTSDEVREVFRQWQESLKGGDDGDTEALRKFLVARKLLTEYQSLLVMRGHSEGFFLDQYKILDLISKGRLVGVFKAMHASGQVVAIKVLPSSKAKEPKVLSRFQREAKLLTKLDHPNVVRAFQVGEDGGRHYFVMEHLDGETLDDVLDRRKRLPPAEAVRLIHQTLLGLQHVFEKGMVHRDLKPSNLMLVPAPTTGPNETTLNSNVKILDIGLGRTTFDENANEPDPETHLTAEGTLLGTPNYLAPEQARSAREADVRADIYSLGCILFQMLTGQVPFPIGPNDGPLTQIVKHATEPPPPLSDFLPQVPEGLQQVLNWMLAKDPNQRYPTPARAAQALQMFLRQSPEAAPAAGPLPEYLKYLAAGGTVETVRVGAGPAPVQPEPAKIPTGRLEPDSRRKERRKESPATRKAGAAVPELTDDSAEVSGDDEYDVEIVAAPPPQSPTKKRERGEPRGLLELDRRDYIMAGIGGGLVLTAILAGYGLSRLFRGTPPTSTTPQEQTQPSDSSGPRDRKPKDTIEPKKDMTDIKKDTTDPKKDAIEAKKHVAEPKDEVKKDEPKKDAAEPKKDEPKKDATDVKKDEPKKDEPKKDDAKKDDVKKDEPKKDAKSKE